MTGLIKKIRSLLHDDTLASFYGCGSPIPPALNGAVVLDLGCGSGVDVFVCSALVGDGGKVIGVDMTEEQLAKANKHVQYHFEKFKEAGYISKLNVEFKKAFIEDLSFIPDNSVDVIISNCVINLSSDKSKVFKECHRILKKGGELYFSDVYASKRIPLELQNDKVLWGECLSGAMYVEDFRRALEKSGFTDHRICSSSIITLNNPLIQKQVGDIVFYSNTVRAFKLDLEDRCEDFGQVATYNGKLTDFPHAFFLDDHHTFVTGYPAPVCGNTADMLSETRYAPYFGVTKKGAHRGLFDCGSAGAKAKPSCGGSSCC
eukprot:TRINITY_DN5469_c0_g1_i4.p1 TRINITY_DN5469_c0_g1~~TRINITY_DN5469_c0_g1_i4.p1  ORF type:complete len:366 (+),score=77.86 TRINITY_DN5469_c0_g1_i4:149-1099(+)